QQNEEGDDADCEADHAAAAFDLRRRERGLPDMLIDSFPQRLLRARTARQALGPAAARTIARQRLAQQPCNASQELRCCMNHGVACYVVMQRCFETALIRNNSTSLPSDSSA